MFELSVITGAYIIISIIVITAYTAATALVAIYWRLDIYAPI